MSETKEETIRVISFDGKKVSWPSWKAKFLARAKRKGYKPVVQGKVTIVPETIEILDDDPNKEEKLKNRDLNEFGYSNLILSINCSTPTGQAAFNLIKNTVSTDYPDGHVGKAWKF